MAEKKLVQQTFDKGANADTDDALIPANMFKYMLNMEIFGGGTSLRPTKVKGNTLISNTLPAGNNQCIGWGKNEETGKLYLLNYNDQGYHGIYAFDNITQAITPVLLNLTDTNGVDILKFDKNFPIYHFDVVDDILAYWVDGKNKARKTNINRCIDKTSTGYGAVVTEDLITAYKQCAVFAPMVTYFTDLARNSNYLYAEQFKFAYRFYYYDKEVSNWGDYSEVALPPNESYLGINQITFANNGINVVINTGSKDVVKIEIGVKIGSLDWVGCAILDKSELKISDYSAYTYAFYNDGAYWTLDQTLVARPYSYLPANPKTQAFVNIAMTYGNFYEGFPVVIVTGSVGVSFKPFYLPSGTVTQFNSPAFTTTLTSNTEHGGIFNSWWTTVTHFVIGHDVKKGNVFSIYYVGGGTGGQILNYTATLSDTAQTVASQIKQYLSQIDAVGTGVVSNESTDGSGNVSFDFTIEAHEGQSPIIFTTYVAPVNYSTLLDNGLSINTIKQGTTRKYGIVYEDDDGRTSLTYTNDSLSIRTPFETETLAGTTVPIGLQQPLHTVKITNQPPVWAKYWRLVRTPDFQPNEPSTNPAIQLLIQSVTEVSVNNQPTYIDMIVGSLLTYQQIHKDTILSYEFQQGDRLRLIKKYDPDTQAQTPYLPYFETEVVGYTADEEIPVNANIRTTIGTPNNHVTPSDGVKQDYVGKNIIISDVERTIVSISGADYVLDQDLSLINSATPETYTVPNYTIVDRRGVIRIKKPTGYDITDLSLVEVYHPVANTNDGEYQNFNDFQQKFAISNWGTDTRAHQGNMQNQDPNDLAGTPAIVQVSQGDAYVRNRAMPTNNVILNPEVLVDQICDPNFSDFYKSNLYSVGRVYPQDRGYGAVKFGSRIRYSGNYIADTNINGLNDFSNTDREDYFDPYGDITLLRFRHNYLFIFKQLRTAWTPVNKRLVQDNSGQNILTTSDKLLNEIEYSAWEGGIGDNTESWVENGTAQYIMSANSGVALRIAQDGSIPISSLYYFDKKVRDLLAEVSKYNLKIPAGFDRPYNNAIWSVDDYIQYLFNNTFNSGDWQTVTNAYPDGTTFAITKQPANATATVVGNQIQITGTNTLGNDFFKFQGTLPDSSQTPIMNFCFTVVDPANRQTSFRGKSASLYCLQSNATVYYNTAISTSLRRNNCPTGQHGTSVPVSVAAGAFTSLISQADADAQAAVDAQNQANATGVCLVDSTLSTLLVDYLTDTTADLCAYVKTTGLTETGIIVTGTIETPSGPLQLPNDGRDPSSCYILSSDKLGSTSPAWRFGINLAYFIQKYTGTLTSIDFEIRGRDTSAHAISGSYAARDISEGVLTLNGPAGSKIPGVSSGSSSPIGFSSNIVSGADGTVGNTVGSPILTLTYNFTTNTISVVTY